MSEDTRPKEQTEPEDENRLIALRREKVAGLRAQGINPYPNRFAPDRSLEQIRDAHGEKSAEELERLTETFSVAGRLMGRREHGNVTFGDLADRSGRIQLFLQKNRVGPENYALLKKFVDVGDILGATGRLFKTRSGELSLAADNFVLLSKAVRPLPEKFHGLQDVETRYRRRYVDLVVNPDVRRTFLTRTRIVRILRDYFDARGFIEVETPMLHEQAGGAAARPFVTHHNALDLDLYLRIAPELHLKRLLVGGLERVYEINRNFRNEGISYKHNPEFTMIEFYQAYATWHDLAALTEDLISKICLELHGAYRIPYQGATLDFTPPFARFTVREAVCRFAGMTPEQVDDEQALLAKARELGIDTGRVSGRGRLQMELFELTAEEKLTDPTFITGFPIEVSPLSRRNDDDPSLADRFELFVAGRELANAFSELNDPADQRERFLEQVRNREEGHSLDEDYIRALEHGMPPAAGEGIGIDRLTMLMTDSRTIREVILFPTMRPGQGQ